MTVHRRQNTHSEMVILRGGGGGGEIQECSKGGRGGEVSKIPRPPGADRVLHQKNENLPKICPPPPERCIPNSK